MTPILDKYKGCLQCPLSVSIGVIAVSPLLLIVGITLLSISESYMYNNRVFDYNAMSMYGYLGIPPVCVC